MKALEVLVNGERRCLAGSGPREFTFATFTLDERGETGATITVAGSRGKMVPIWVSEDRLKDGDEVLMRVVDVCETDAPMASSPAWTEFPQMKINWGEE
jgi:hypothetical protein